MPVEAQRFVAETGVDYLSISAGIALVLHGASCIPENEVPAARAAGVHKFNAGTDLRHAFRAGIEAVWSKGDYQLEDAMAEGRVRMVGGSDCREDEAPRLRRKGAALR